MKRQTLVLFLFTISTFCLAISSPSLVRATDPAPSAPAPTAAPAPAAQGTYKVGDAVLAFWGQSWWNAQIIKVQNGKYCVKWDGYDDSWNECGLGPDRLKSK